MIKNEKKDMKKSRKRGFTLVELLVTIGIIGVILTISSVSVYTIINNSKENSNKIAIDNMKKSAGVYVKEYNREIAWDEDNTTCIPIQTLVSKGYVKKEVLDNDAAPLSIVLTRDEYNIIISEREEYVDCDTYSRTVPIPTNEDICNNFPYDGDNHFLINQSIVMNDYSKIEYLNTTYKNTTDVSDHPKNAGEYKVSVSLADGKQWEDNTKKSKTVTCKIKKRTPVLNLDSMGNSDTQENIGTKEIILTSEVSGTVSIKSSNNNYVTAKVKDNNVITANTDKVIEITTIATRNSTTTVTITVTPTGEYKNNYEKASIVYTVGNVNTINIAKPTAEDSCNNLIYNGNSQILAKTNEAYSLVNNSAIEIGTYTVTARLKYGYVWNDNTTDNVEFSCEIQTPKPKVTYKDAACNSSVIEVIYNQPYGENQSLCTPTKIGYTFNGWYSDNNYTNKVTNDTIVTNFNDHNLYAKWTANTYTISYSYNGGKKGSSAPTEATYDESFTISKPTKTVTVTGDANGTGATIGSATSKAQTFAGWTSTTINTSTAYYGSTAWTSTDTKVTATSFKNLTPTQGAKVTMIANWTPVKFKLPTVSKTGYTCNWNTEADGSGTSYSSGENYTPSATSSASITVYARCTANTYNINYTLNGGSSGSSAPTEATYGEVVTISKPTKTVTVTGDANGTGATIGSATSKAQTFAGWTSTTIDTATAYYGSTKWASTDTKVTATSFKNLTPKSGATVTLVSNWTAVALNLPTVSKTGHTCKWNTKADGSGTSYSSGASYTPSAKSSASITMYATCTAKVLTMTLDKDGGTGGTDGPIYLKYGSGWYSDSDATTKITKITIPTKTGYTFAGYFYTAASGTEMTVVDANGTIKSSNTAFTVGHTITAKWTTNTYNINYTLNGGSSGSSAPTEATYGEVITISNPTKTVTVTGNANGTGATIGSATSKAQTFTGWTSTTIDTATAYYGSTKWTSTSTKVTATSFKNLTPTSGATVTLVSNWTAVALNLPTVSKTGYTCNWNTKSDGSGTSYSSGGSYTPSATSSAAITLYAECSPNSYTITFNANGGDVSTSNKNVTYAAKYGELPTPTKSGYTFDGWFTGLTDGNEITADTTVAITSAKTLYAHWTLATTFTSEEFAYTGNVQEFEVPADGIYTLEVWGAQGGSTYEREDYGSGIISTGIGGKGGYASGNVELEGGTTLYIVVGGKGGDSKDYLTNVVTSSDYYPLYKVAGGYNGGGYSWWEPAHNAGGCGGGGATHIATNTGLLSSLSDNEDKILIVAGGGGGASRACYNYYVSGHGGAGGGADGSSGGDLNGNSTSTSGYYAYGAAGATTTEGAGFGQGRQKNLKTSYGIEEVTHSVAGGGGGGYYGGYGPGDTSTFFLNHKAHGENYYSREYSGGGGGGGAGYVGACISGTTSTQQGVREGNGYAIITLVRQQ